MECLNCGTKCKGAYCPTCGQKTSVGRFQLKEIAVNTINSLLTSDNKIWRTCSCLLSRPGHMIREYLLGKRVRYYAPVQLLVCLVAIYAIATYFFTDALSPFDVVRLDMKPDHTEVGSSAKLLSYYQILLGNRLYYAIFSVLICVPFYRFVFRKQYLSRPTEPQSALNMAEHFIALTYQVCFNMILAFLLIPFTYTEEGKTIVAWICVVMPSIYCFIIYKQLLSISWRKSIWLNILAILLGMMLNMAILLTLYGTLYGIEQIKI